MLTTAVRLGPTGQSFRQPGPSQNDEAGPRQHLAAVSAEGERFELSVGLTPQRFSRPPH